MAAKFRNIFELYKVHGGLRCINGNITKIQHATQTALLAEADGYNKKIILAAFLHDIGDLIHHVNITSNNINNYWDSNAKFRLQNGNNNLNNDNKSIPDEEHINNYFIGHQANIGSSYLRNYHVPFLITNMVEQHINSKRFSATVRPEYFNNMDVVPRELLISQGGLMTKEEMVKFISDPIYDYHLKLCDWDSKAYSTDKELLDIIDNMNPVEKYYEMALDVIPQ